MKKITSVENISLWINPPTKNCKRQLLRTEGGKVIMGRPAEKKMRLNDAWKGEPEDFFHEIKTDHIR